MYTLYSMRRSGNCYKVRLALTQLGLAHELVEVDILQGETRTPEFLAMNPSGHVPLLKVAPDKYLPESNAILWYLAEGTPLLSDDPIERAATLQWMFFEQHALEPNLGAAWFWLVLIKGGRDLQQHALEDWMEEGYRALGVMDKHLAQQDLRLHPHRRAVRFQCLGVPRGTRLARPCHGAAQPRLDGLASHHRQHGCGTVGAVKVSRPP